jgi:hypothetical protein
VNAGSSQPVWRVALAAACALAALCGAASPRVARAQNPPPAEARVERSTLAMGENLSLEIVAHGPVNNEPAFDVPAGLEMLGSGRSQNFSWINGRSSAETIFHYELGAARAGHYTLGPFHVSVNGQAVTVPAIEINVMAAPTSIGAPGGGTGPATLLADVEPHDPYVGQPVLLRVRLVQRAQLAEDPQYAPPSTPGFWSEVASQPESYYAAEGNARVLVTETRTRLYPLASGTQTVGEAVARLALLQPGSNDPALWLSGRVPRQEMVVRSQPVRVHVRPLPPGAPAGFGGAVGVLSARWSCDRARTARDVPATVELEVRGIGNLSLIHAPPLDGDDFEVFSGTTEDSLGTPGQAAAGRRTFRWTVLPRREGTLQIPAPAFQWFDPSAETYRTASLSPLALEVGPALRAASTSEQSFPSEFFEHPVSPFGKRVQPWTFAIAGLLAGGSIVSWRGGGRPEAAAERRAEIASRRAALAGAGGAAFWKLAEETAGWLESEQALPAALRDRIAQARYSSGTHNPAPVRRDLDALLAARTPRGGALPRRALSTGMMVVALALAFVGAGRPGPVAAARAVREADSAARTGDFARARAGWIAPWKAGSHDAGLAARLAWYEIRAGSVGPAAAWVLAGENDEAREPALGWVRERVREAGGLIGEGGGRLPVRRVEWAALAAGFALAAALLWRRRRLAATLAVLALASAAAFPLEGEWIRRLDRAVVRTPSTVEGTEIELEPGQVVRITGRQGDRVKVLAGRGTSGWIPARAVFGIGELD